MSWSYFKFWVGRLANLAGYPALVRECDYHSNALETSVKVKRLELYTLVSVNGLDVYFNRFTGAIDGVGSIPTSGCTIPDAKTHGSVHSDELPSERQAPVHKQTDAAHCDERKG